MEKTEKLFYSIGEVSEMLELNPSAIRYYIKEFNLKIDKNKKGNHLFRDKDIQKLKQIVQLIKEEGYTLNGAKEHLKQNNKINFSEEKSAILKSKLLSIREKLEQLKKEL